MSAGICVMGDMLLPRGCQQQIYPIMVAALLEKLKNGQKATAAVDSVNTAYNQMNTTQSAAASNVETQQEADQQKLLDDGRGVMYLLADSEVHI